MVESGGTPSGAGNGAKRVPRTAEEVRHSIELSLQKRISSPDTRAGRIEDEVESRLGNAWHAAKTRPSLGVAVAMGIGLAAASVVGVGELAMGIAFGYAAYQVLRKGASLEKAVKDSERMIR
jgi:hypothetical protein